jgi:hypothetical protein
VKRKIRKKSKPISKPRARFVDPETRRALTESLAVPVSIASLALGAGEYATYKGIKDGGIPSIKVGRKILVPTMALRQMLGIDGDGPKAA